MVNNSHGGLETPAVARQKRKATLKKRRNTAPGFIWLDPKKSYMLVNEPYCSDSNIIFE